MLTSTTLARFMGASSSRSQRPIAASVPTDAWSGVARRAVDETPPWILVVAAGAVAVVLLLMVYLVARGVWRYQSSRRMIRAEELVRIREEKGDGAALGLTGMGRAGWVALSGTLVSQYGLWEFGRDTAHLPVPIRIGFVIMFDLLELQLFSLLYRNANPDEGWTRSLRLTHGTAWTLVFASSVANFSHAPNLASAPFMALMPPATAWVIELELRKRMADAERNAREQHSTVPAAGPARLVGLLWKKLWIGVFSVLTLDPSAGGVDGVVSRALTRKAAMESHRLRQLLVEEDELRAKLHAPGSDVGRNGERQLKDIQARLAKVSRKVDKQRARRQRCLDRANFDEPERQLQVLRRKAALTHTDAVARLDHETGTEAIELMERINVVASADLIAASERAAEVERHTAQVEEEKQRAQAALDDARKRLAAVEKAGEQRLAEVEEAVQQAAEALRKTTVDYGWEMERLEQLREERRRLEDSGAASHQLYQAAEERVVRLERQQEEERAERVRLLAMLEEERSQLTGVAELAREEARSAQERLLVLEGEHRGLRQRLEDLQLSAVVTAHPGHASEPEAAPRGVAEGIKPGQHNRNVVRRRADRSGARATQGAKVVPEQPSEQGSVDRPPLAEEGGGAELPGRELEERGDVDFDPDDPKDGGHAQVLAKMTNADAVRHAIQVLGTFESGDLVDWLGRHGKKVNRGQAYKVAGKAAQRKAAEEAGRPEKRGGQQQAVA
ncbi:hypothetical protein ACH4PU_30960 [Streptomyces sp. NPDC021100]|uniref:hypothetical protein n=1 Tax=Streptomyces sp. NPDC021100 TaxID=3365114 RepID=UPI00379CACED